MGGILILFAVITAVLLWQDLSSKYTWVTLVSLILFGGIGFADDYLKVVRRNSSGLPGR